MTIIELFPWLLAILIAVAAGTSLERSGFSGAWTWGIAVYSGIVSWVGCVFGLRGLILALEQKRAKKQLAELEAQQQGLKKKRRRRSFRRWIEQKVFKIDVYELREDEVVPGRRREPRFKVRDIASWQQVFICFGVPLIVIQFADGRMLELSDKHEDLLHILQRAIPEKELPWTAV